MDELIISSNGTNYIPNDTNEKCFVSNGETYPLCKWRKQMSWLLCLWELWGVPFSILKHVWCYDSVRKRGINYAR